MPRIGLRLRIVFALTVAFVIAFILLAVATVQLTHRARVADREHDTAAAAELFLSALGSEPDRVQFIRLAEATIGHGGVRGAELTFNTTVRREPWVRGVTQLGSGIEARAEGHTLRLWVRPPETRTRGPFDRLLLLYFALTGGAILLLAYVALTVMIVRPVDQLTLASTRLASGNLEVDVPVKGAAEVARLAESFNEMARQLKHDRHELEERVHELQRASVSLATAEAQVLRSERLASVGRLSAGVAHEIGNPLSAILGLVELVRSGDLDSDEQDEFLGRVQKETERIHTIIRGLLDYSRRGDDADDAEADLAEVVEDAVALVAPQKELDRVEIEVVHDTNDAFVKGSADHLKQLVLNLLLNAADAMADEREGAITIALSREAHFVVMSLTDSGPGIKDDVIEHLFEPFVTTKPTGKGTGLGLAVCHSIVEHAGGTIEAENVDGGARFTVKLLPAHE